MATDYRTWAQEHGLSRHTVNIGTRDARPPRVYSPNPESVRQARWISRDVAFWHVLRQPAEPRSSMRPDVPWNRGSWRSEAAPLQELAALRDADGRVHFAGDYMTDMTSWMQGAFESARETATAIHERAVTR